jgi:hypothetical protein
MRRPLGRALGTAVLLVAGAFSAVTTTAGVAQAVAAGTSGQVNAVGAGKCLDLPNQSTTAGTQLQINTCSGGASQLWTYTGNSQLTVSSGSSTMCLDAYGKGTTPGTKVEI